MVDWEEEYKKLSAKYPIKHDALGHKLAWQIKHGNAWYRDVFRVITQSLNKQQGKSLALPVWVLKKQLIHPSSLIDYTLYKMHSQGLIQIRAPVGKKVIFIYAKEKIKWDELCEELNQ